MALLSELADSCLGGSHARWRHQVKQIPASTRQRRGSAVAAVQPGTGTGFWPWWIVMLTGTIAVVWAGAGTLPPKHYVTSTFAERLEWAWPVGLPAAALMLLLAILPVPRGVRLNHNASATTILILVFTLLPLVMLAARWLSAPDTVPVPEVWPWIAGMLVSLAAGVVILLRTRKLPQAAPTVANHERLRLARHLVRNAPSDATATRAWQDWSRGVAALDGLPANVRTQALHLGPFAYLVSAHMHAAS